MKFFFDQTVAGVMNIVLFIVLINFLKGESLGRVWELVLEVCCVLLSAPRWDIHPPREEMKRGC